MQKNKNLLKIIASTSVTLFSLCICFIATFAWFYANRAVDTTGNGFITSAEPSKISKVEIYSEDTSSTTVTHYKYSTTPTSTYEDGEWSSTSFDLGTYSSLDRIHTSLIVITLTEEENYSYDINTSTDYSSSLVSFSNNQPKNKLQEKDNPLSSIIRFLNVNYLDSFDYSNTVSTDENKLSFVNKEGTTFPEENYRETISVTSENSSNKIAIIVEYYPDALQFIYSINLGNDVLNNDVLTFKCDWGIVIE